LCTTLAIALPRLFVPAFLTVFILITMPLNAVSLNLSPNPKRSAFFGFTIGAGLDLDFDARHVRDLSGRTPEAYALMGLMFGLSGGFRFNEFVGIEGGWQRSGHLADPDWGGGCEYNLLHTSLRFAVPTASRQTPVFKLGLALGNFLYGNVAGTEKNGTMIMGGRLGFCLEHELLLGVIVVFELSYSPVFRYGMRDKLYLSVDYDDGHGPITEDVKDFTHGRWVHLLLAGVGVQFDWPFR